MAVNKRKVLDAARKYAQKGAKEKALKEYNTLLKLDPRDAKLHLEIGDAYRRWGQMDEAVTQYTRVAEQYKQDGFDARAVAVYKQILNIDSKRYTAHVALSEVYQRMGLEAEAVQALQAAADGYRQEGKKREALELLRRMAQLDPTNTTSRLKVAELLQQEGMEDDAVAEYEAVAEELERSGASEQVPPIYERILELRPARGDLLIGMARHYVDAGEPGRAEPFACRALESAPGEAELHELLCEIYKALDRPDELESATRTLAQIYRERGDEERARQIMQRLPSAPELDFGGDEEPSIASAPPDEDLGLGGDELLDDDDLLVADDDDFDEPEAPEPLPAPEGDPDQLFAEASVYLRYGKRDQAVASLEAILVQEPDHRDALEKLGEAHADAGNEARAVELWSRAAELARGAGDGEAFDVLHGRIESLDPEAAAELGPPAAEEGEELGDLELELEDGLGEEPDEDLDFGADPASDAAAEPALETGAPDLTGDVEVDLDDFEFEDPGLADDDAAAPADEELEIAVDLEEIDELDEGPGELAAGSQASQSVGGGSSTMAQEIQDELEEAEFYFEQDLLDEARGLYERVLEKAPNHPSALLRMGEIEARQGAAGTAEGDEEPAFEEDVDGGLELAFDDEQTAEDEGGLELGVDDGEDDDLAAALADAAESVGGDGGSREPVEELGGQPAEDDTLETLEAADAPIGSGGERLAGLGEDTTEVVEAGDLSDSGSEALAGRAEVTQPVPADAEEGDFDLGRELAAEDEAAAATAAGDDAAFDLGAELRESLEEDEAGRSGSSTSDDGFASLFNDFKKGVSETLSESDYETRYDLGIAYREMELYDDAIGEFRMCLDSPALRTRSLHLMALCALDLGRAADAVGHLEQALAGDDGAGELQRGIRFDLGRAYQGMGDAARARSSWESVRSEDPGFPGLDEALAGLAAPAPIEVAEPQDADFESFDDLVAEAEAPDDGPAEAEAFESFDDVITEAEAVDEAVLEAEPIGEAEAAEPSPDPDDSSGSLTGSGDPKPGRRKKKISFV